MQDKLQYLGVGILVLLGFWIASRLFFMAFFKSLDGYIRRRNDERPKQKQPPGP